MQLAPWISLAEREMHVAFSKRLTMAVLLVVAAANNVTCARHCSRGGMGSVRFSSWIFPARNWLRHMRHASEPSNQSKSLPFSLLFSRCVSDFPAKLLAPIKHSLTHVVSFICYHLSSSFILLKLLSLSLDSV